VPATANRVRDQCIVARLSSLGVRSPESSPAPYSNRDQFATICSIKLRCAVLAEIFTPGTYSRRRQRRQLGINTSRRILQDKPEPISRCRTVDSSEMRFSVRGGPLTSPRKMQSSFELGRLIKRLSNFDPNEFGEEGTQTFFNGGGGDAERGRLFPT